MSLKEEADFLQSQTARIPTPTDTTNNKISTLLIGFFTIFTPAWCFEPVQLKVKQPAIFFDKVEAAGIEQPAQGKPLDER